MGHSPKIAIACNQRGEPETGNSTFAQWPAATGATRRPGIRNNPPPRSPSPLAPAPIAMNRHHYAISLHQATQESPTLARLTALTRDSSERLKAIEALIPPMLRPAIQAGPIEGDCWCLLVSSNAAAAKVRQLLPAFQAHLRSRGWEVASIRLKIQR